MLHGTMANRPSREQVDSAIVLFLCGVPDTCSQQPELCADARCKIANRLAWPLLPARSNRAARRHCMRDSGNPRITRRGVLAMAGAAALPVRLAAAADPSVIRIA